MQAKIISDNIGWDGNGFFCRRCGKAGYSRLPQVKGHLAMCPGTAISRGAIPRGQLAGQLVAASWQPVGSASVAGVTEQASYQQQQQPQPANNQLAQASYPASQLGYPAYQDLNGRVSRLENEYQHSLIQRNAPGGFLGLDKNALIIIIAIGLFIYFVTEQQRASRVCPTAEGNTKAPAKAKGIGNIGEKVVTKFTDKFVSKAADSLFK